METTEQQKLDFCQGNCLRHSGEVIHRIDCVLGLRERLKQEEKFNRAKELLYVVYQENIDEHGNVEPRTKKQITKPISRAEAKTICDQMYSPFQQFWFDVAEEAK